jgi:hypothetical protein
VLRLAEANLSLLGSILGPSHGGACVAAVVVIVVVVVVVALLPLLARPGSADIPYRFMMIYVYIYVYIHVQGYSSNLQGIYILHVEMMNKCRMYWKYQAIGNLHTSRLHL